MKIAKILYGSQNFGYNIDSSDEDWMYIHVPSLEDIVINKEYRKEKTEENGTVIKHKDIRYLIHALDKGNFNDLQILFSKKSIDNDILDWFIKNRYELLSTNLKRMYSSNKGYILSCIQKYNSTKDYKDYIRALCFYQLLIKVKSKQEFNFCNNELKTLREKQEIFIAPKDIISSVELLEHDFNKPLNENLMEEVKNQIGKIIIKSIMEVKNESCKK